MASTYFDPVADKAMVREAYQDVGELAAVAALAERDVLRAYTGTEKPMPYVNRFAPPSVPATAYALPLTASGVQRYVYLAGYQPDAAQAPADLLEALKATIADVVSWRVSQGKNNPTLQIQFANGTSNNFRADANDAFPARWRWRLADFDLRPDQDLYHI